MDKCTTCNKEITTDCDYKQGRCPHRKSMIDIEPLLKIAIQPKDTSRGHFWVSMVKSGFRIVAGVALVLGYPVDAGVWLIAAESLGIVEELV